MKVRRAGRFKVLDFPPWQPGWDFWPMWTRGEWEPETKAVIDELAPDRRCVDIGAWVGPTVLWMVEAGASSFVAYEPDPVAYGVLTANLRLNNIPTMCLPTAVAPERGSIRLHADDFGESLTGLRGEHSISVWATDLDTAVDGAGFVKCDIEGGEQHLLSELRALDCPALVSLHRPWWTDDVDWSGGEVVGGVPGFESVLYR